MKLHYSQTISENEVKSLFVSVPYEITLLSNLLSLCAALVEVSVPYEITLLSNITMMLLISRAVSVPYEITLLSNI